MRHLLSPGNDAGAARRCVDECIDVTVGIRKIIDRRDGVSDVEVGELAHICRIGSLRVTRGKSECKNERGAYDKPVGAKMSVVVLRVHDAISEREDTAPRVGACPPSSSNHGQYMQEDLRTSNETCPDASLENPARGIDMAGMPENQPDSITRYPVSNVKLFTLME